MWLDGLHLSAGSGLVVVAAMVAAALLMDRILGEPSRFHPLVGFGRWASWVEKQCRKQIASTTLPSPSPRRIRISGMVAWALAVLPIALLACLLLVWLFYLSPWLWLAANVVVLYLTIGGNSLVFHASEIYHPLKKGDLTLAREKIGLIVSRETTTMDAGQITSAAVESVLENGNDAVFGALFWFVVAGAPGALIFRMANTLDAMWGYKNERYYDFGFAAAKLDDLLGWLPARLTAVTYGIQGNLQSAMKCWKEQAPLCSSPNGGVVMCAGAGALNTSIGGPAIYHGKRHDKIYMGCGEFADYQVIPQANRLVNHGAWIWVLVLLLIGLG
ncbi:adenosylcobinamide-phosphate synthase CbiB [Photobacterium lipolyticum]|uniref:Cobalamin biosynthesis protein CobD n=1 Tax=Photobacterium lipolyticum TaxID=266810 RepID=A0A2T3N0Z9_9GAMM|nr:adenosylcobinamide-phosphate synthase CbiB [Photobacterium lipolyticum]PSW05973.1 cobalamin biosynthesis protein [Photobacterium lipolyticum]